MDDEGFWWICQAIEKLENLQQLILNVGRNKITANENKYFEHLFRNKEKMHFMNLNLEVNQFGDEGCKYLAQNILKLKGL